MHQLAAFRKGFNATGYIEGQNTIDDWLEGQYDRLSSLMGDLVRRRVAVIGYPTTFFQSVRAPQQLHLLDFR